MTWARWRADNRAGWDDRVDIHTGPKGYDVDALLRDPQRLSPTVENDRQALGSLAGLDVVHLQCHLGTDTLSLARLGAKSVSGLDFSSQAIAHCRSLFERTGTAGHFVEGDPDSDMELRLRYPYGEQVEPVTMQGDQTYIGDGTPLVHRTTHEWSHGLG